jgi:hypothetical protein
VAAGNKAAIAIGAVVLLLLLSKRSNAAPNMLNLSATATRDKRDKTFTGDNNIATWARSRYQAAHDYLAQQGIEDTLAHDIALSVLAHWDNETNGGKNEFNYNVGGIHKYGSQPYYEAADAGNAAQFAAYDSLAAGVKAYFSLISNSYYADCWALLKAKPTESDWYECLGKKKYYGADPTKAASTWATLRANMAQYADASASH